MTATKSKRVIYTVQHTGKPRVIDTEAAQAKARRAAEKGTEEFRRWWSSPEGAECRVPAKTILTELQKIASDAERNHQAPIDDPWADTDDTTMTPEQRAEFDAATADARTAG